MIDYLVLSSIQIGILTSTSYHNPCLVTFLDLYRMFINFYLFIFLNQ